MATIIAGFGILASFLIPTLVFFIKNLRKRPIEQTKMFD